MNPKVIHPIVFDSDESDDSDFQSSCTESMSKSVQEVEPKNHQKNSENGTLHEVRNEKVAVRPPKPNCNHRINSPIYRRPSIVRKPRNYSVDPRPSSAPSQSATEEEMMVNIFEITEPEFVTPHSFSLTFKKTKGLLKKSWNFVFLEKGQKIYEITLNTLSDRKIVLNNEVIMYIRHDRTDFVFKSNSEDPKSLSRVSFISPIIGVQCQRNTVIRFGHETGGMLPHKIISLPFNDERAFKGHFYVESKRNVALAILNTSIPVISARQINKHILEVETNLNLSTALLFGISIALCIGKNPPAVINDIFIPRKSLQRTPSYEKKK
ncbi:hypothetical protein TRFO_34121 [Tritrichomonas foetus]|uniref:Uncharacterized protein n=1 Tax=Tritrichomonas foetus TaxID=1144522 RepID=A0A1J4JJQ4_9EUKA|nr:hypothetical protein TRFO_34121 [Tritrichomonas foetus]|eukprot:OHS99402.1 hypothetical protein TRFO_34121 [Tritrichomonas foetus]